VTTVTSGGLSVSAGGDVGSAQLFLADGTGSVTAGGGLTAVLPAATGTALTGSAFYLQDSSMQAQARLGINLDGLYNPTALGQPLPSGAPAAVLNGNYFSYTEGAGVTLTTTSGDVLIGAAGRPGQAKLLGSAVTKAGAANAAVFPGTLVAEALGGNINLGGGSEDFLFPDPNGQLELAAATNITGGHFFGSPALEMSDAPLASLATVSTPSARGPINVPAGGVIHSGDLVPAVLVAGQDITELGLSVPKAAQITAGRDLVDFVLEGQNINPNDLTLVSAGRDIVYQDTCANGCGIEVGGPGRLDLVAGRNVNLAFSSGITTNGNLLNPNLPTSTGADLTVLAGAAAGPNYSTVITQLISPTDTAADLKSLAAIPASTASGFETALDGFVNSVVAASPAYQWQLEYFVRDAVTTQTGKDPGALGFTQAGTLYGGLTPTLQAQWLTALQEFMHTSATQQAALVSYVETATGVAGLNLAQALTGFAALNANAQRPFADQVFFGELQASGLDANVIAGVGFSRGYAAIDTLFPGSRAASPDAGDNPYPGDLTLVFSRIYTLSGGNISLFAPGGLLNVGLANPPANFTARDPSTLGIVADRAGDVSIYSAGDVLVNASRIFTLGGGNILVWSNEGSIDAGRGAKSAVSAPPPALLINANGTVTLNFSGAATGSGIRTIQTDPSLPLGDVSLIAPVGTVNAGDAGIGAAGNINIAAQRVLGLDNIQFGGTSTGVPAQVSSLGATLSAVSSAAGASTQASTSSAAPGESKQSSASSLADSAVSWLDVFVTGLGEENCDVKDIECIKRQKSSVSH